MGYCHKLVKQTAQGIAGAFYEVAASDNEFYRLHPHQMRFVRAHWGDFTQPARESLATLLGQSATPEPVKAEIYQALLLDQSAPRGGKHRVVDRHTLN